MNETIVKDECVIVELPAGGHGCSSGNVGVGADKSKHDLALNCIQLCLSVPSPEQEISNLTIVTSVSNTATGGGHNKEYIFVHKLKLNLSTVL